MSGNFTSIGSGNGVQITGEPLYNGLQEEWINESIDLSFYANKSQVWIRFLLKSDGAVEEDGFYFDNFSAAYIVCFRNLSVSSAFFYFCYLFN